MKTPEEQAIRGDSAAILEPNDVLEREPAQDKSTDHGRLDANLDAPDAVEAALADALAKAAAAGRFDVVGQLARELVARRHASTGLIVFADEFERRGRR